MFVGPYKGIRHGALATAALQFSRGVAWAFSVVVEAMVPCIGFQLYSLFHLALQQFLMCGGGRVSRRYAMPSLSQQAEPLVLPCLVSRSMCIFCAWFRLDPFPSSRWFSVNLEEYPCTLLYRVQFLVLFAASLFVYRLSFSIFDLSTYKRSLGYLVMYIFGALCSLF